MPLILKDLDPSTSTGADLVGGETDTDTGCPPPPACEDGQALVGVLDDLADVTPDPLAFIPAAAVVIWWYIRRRRKLAAKPPQGV